MFNRSPLPCDEADQFVNLGRYPAGDVEISPARIWTTNSIGGNTKLPPSPAPPQCIP
jgi:hypothetical protein